MIKLKDLLFEEKLNEEAKGYKQALQKFIKYGNKQIKAYFKKHYDTTHDRGQYRQITVLKPGKKYDRVVNVRADEPKKSDGGVHCFIERETGLIYKPKSWTGPAKGPRASIFKPATYKKIDPHGSWLYKIMKEGKLNEFDGSSKVVKLPNGVKVKIEFDGLTFIGGTKPVFLDRNEMMTFFKATRKYLK